MTSPTDVPEPQAGGRVMDPATVQAAIDRQAPAVRHAIKAQQHLLVAVASYVLPDEALDDPHAHVSLDPEHLLGIMLGCYVCGRPWDERMARRRCRGPLA